MVEKGRKGGIDNIYIEIDETICNSVSLFLTVAEVSGENDGLRQAAFQLLLSVSSCFLFSSLTPPVLLSFSCNFLSLIVDIQRTYICRSSFRGICSLPTSPSNLPLCSFFLLLYFLLIFYSLFTHLLLTFYSSFTHLLLQKSILRRLCIHTNTSSNTVALCILKIVNNAVTNRYSFLSTLHLFSSLLLSSLLYFVSVLY